MWAISILQHTISRFKGEEHEDGHAREMTLCRTMAVSEVYQGLRLGRVSM